MKNKEEATYALALLAGSKSWNTTRQSATLIKVIRGLLRGDLMKKVREEFNSSENMYLYMGDFYKEITKINKLFNIDKNSIEYMFKLKRTMFPQKNRMDVLTNSILYSNFTILQNEGLLEKYINEFNGYFRGEIKDVLRIPHSDIIIFECHQKPFSNEKQYHWNEPDEIKFYSNKNISYVWRTFEDCLFNAMFPQHSNSVIALYNLEKESKN